MQRAVAVGVLAFWMVPAAGRCEDVLAAPEPAREQEAPTVREEGDEPRVTGLSQEEKIVRAVRDGQLERVRATLDLRPYLARYRSPQAETLLHVAASAGHEELVAALLERGVDLEAQNATGDSALDVALDHQRESVAARLVKSGAVLRAADASGVTVLHRAARYGYARLLDELIARGVDVHQETVNGETALHWATRRATVDRLLRAGARLHARSRQLRTALHLAAERGDLEVIEAILDAGGAVNPRDEHGDTPLGVAEAAGQAEAAARLRAYGAEADRRQPNIIRIHYQMFRDNVDHFAQTSLYRYEERHRR